MTRAPITALPWAAALALLTGPALGQDGVDARDAQLAYNSHCRTCHVTNPDDHRLGPSLHGVVGRVAGAAPGFRYSSALAGAGFVWDEERLDRFIANPDAVVPGNNMKPFSGLASAEERAKVIAHLKAEGG
jgi:cytochrome c